MGKHRPQYWITAIVTGSLLLLGLILLAACAAPTAEPTIPPPTPSPSITPTPPPTSTPLPVMRTQRSLYPTPRLTPVVTIPPPLDGIELPIEARVLALIGTDSVSPFPGRSDALVLAIYHPRLGRTSLLSVPPDLFGYVPGYTMQRFNTAWAVGGFRMLADTLEYNLGVRPDDYVLVHLDDFVYFIDDLGGLEVTIAEPLPSICGDIPQGTNVLSGDQLICYLRFRNGPDELSRNLRQQEVLRLIIQRMARGGSLVQLPDLFATYRRSVESSLSLDNLLFSIPYFIRLSDADHLGYFQLAGDALIPWQIPDGLNPIVFLPDKNAIRVQVQDAIDFIRTPVVSSDRVITLVYELTISPTPTVTHTSTATPTVTNTLPPTSSPTVTPTNTPTPTGSITITITTTATPSSTP
jgi:LCP family protein required for cell wall assembly